MAPQPITVGTTPFLGILQKRRVNAVHRMPGPYETARSLLPEHRLPPRRHMKLRRPLLWAFATLSLAALVIACIGLANEGAREPTIDSGTAAPTQERHPLEKPENASAARTEPLSPSSPLDPGFIAALSRINADWCDRHPRPSLDEAKALVGHAFSVTTLAWNRSLNASNDARSQAAAQVLLALNGSSDQQTEARKALTTRALASNDPAIMAWALRLGCTGTQGCETQLSSQWRAIEPDNFAAWTASSGAPTQLSEWLKGNRLPLSNAKRLNPYRDELMAIIDTLPGLNTPGLIEGVGVLTRQRAGQLMSVRPSRSVMRACQFKAAGDGEFAAVCEGIAEQFWAASEGDGEARREMVALVSAASAEGAAWRERMGQLKVAEGRADAEAGQAAGDDLLRCDERGAAIAKEARRALSASH